MGWGQTRHPVREYGVCGGVAGAPYAPARRGDRTAYGEHHGRARLPAGFSRGPVSAIRAVTTATPKAGKPSRIVRALRRGSWGVADQALSSVTNFALGVFVARAVAPSAFGAFSLAFASFLIVFSASRALATQPFVVRFSDVSNEEWRRGARLASGSALTIGITAGTMFVAVGLIAA